MKLCAALIGLHDAEMRQLLESLSLFPGATIGHRFPYYPERAEIERFLHAADADVLFISTARPVQMESAVRQVTQIFPNVQIVLIDSEARPETLRRAMQLGVRECLSLPLVADDVRGVMERSMRRRANIAGENVGTNCLYSFLPARAGVGASILATQAALSLPLDDPHRGLLIDADLDGGMIQFLLKAENPHSFIEAMEQVEQLDEHLWPQFVSDHGNLDIMQAGDSGGDYRPDLVRLQQVLAFARSQYSVILVDLPSAINRLSTELMLQSKAVFLVTTPEVASLYMTRRRLRALQDLQLGDRVRLLVNRVEKKGQISMDDVASTAGLPVDSTFINDEADVQKEILAGGRLSAARPLGRQLTNFAAALFRDHAPVPRARSIAFLKRSR